MATSGVYKILCCFNQKMYIGSSYNIERRIKTHFRQLAKNKHINPHLQNAYNRYGLKNFSWQIIEECGETDLISREQFWMDSVEAYNRQRGFNNCIKSDRPTGYKHTDCARQKMREHKLGKPLSKEHVKNIIDSRLGFKHSEETKKKISEANSGINNGMYGKKEEEAHKIERMKNCLSKPRWNTGLTKENDERIKKLATRTGKLPHNALKCELLDKETGRKYFGNSLKKLAKESGLSLMTINRIKSGTCGKNNKERYVLNIL